MSETSSTILITGASAGIGAACARAFARSGDRVILAARSTDKLTALASELNEAHGVSTALALPLDVSVAGAHQAALATLPDDWREIDVFVANAGLVRGMKPVYEQTPEEIDAMVNTNVKGVLYGISAIVPAMVRQGRGHVITLGSTAGHYVYPNGTVYCATKHAVLAITLGLKQDLHGTPVRVSAVSPGIVETDFSLVRFDGDKEQADAVYSDTNALTADDVADAVLYCAKSPASVNIQEVLMTPRAQSGLMVARGPEAMRL